MSFFALKAFKDNYIWIINQTSSFFCFDPGDYRPVIAYAKQERIDLNAILVTHYHADHVGGIEQLIKHFPNVSVFEPNNTSNKLSLPPYQFDILQTPGHTKNHICYFEPHKRWLFCGDTLFSAGCGRVFDGTIEALYASLKQLKALPDDAKVFCAHEYTRQNLKFSLMVEPDNKTARIYLDKLEAHPEQISLPSTIGLEKEINPFFRLDAPAIKTYTKEEAPDKVFAALRAAKDRF